MKKIFELLVILSLVVAFSCTHNEDFDVENYTANAVEGGLLNIESRSINYVVGNTGPYTANFIVPSGKVTTQSVDIYKTFYRDTLQSETVLFETIEVTNTGQISNLSFEFSLSDLVEGLSINGNALSADEADYLIGDTWVFTYFAYTSTGNIVENPITTRVTVATRYAGTYRFVEGEYWRIGVLSSAGDYWFDEYLFESIDAITYRMIGLSAWIDNELYFQIQADGSITYPAEWKGVPQILNDQPLITCALNLGDLPNVNCGNSNYVVKDDVEGKDRLYMSFGYNTAGSGPREFYQVMEKVPE